MFCFYSRVGAKNSGTRFLSFVDTMLGYRHLLTADDLNKAASMCSSLKGHLRSRFLVLSDDRDPPPPPVRGKRGHPDAETEQPTGGKRFQVRAQVNQVNQSSVAPAQISAPVGVPSIGQRDLVSSQPHAQVGLQSEVTIVSSVPVQDLNVSAPFEPVRARVVDDFRLVSRLYPSLLVSHLIDMPRPDVENLQPFLPQIPMPLISI